MRDTAETTDPTADGVRITNLSKQFGATRALNNVSFHLAPGRVYALVGENGSGKSTLIKAIGGVVLPDAGEIVVDGRVLRVHTPRTSLASGVSVVYQELLLAPQMTVLDNLFLWDTGWVRGSIAAQQRRVRANRVLADLATAPPELDAFVGELNLGGQQVVAIARALLREADSCVVFDEATSALDKRDAARLLAASRRLAERGKVVIFVSHRMDEVMEVSDAAIVLRNGRLVGKLSRNELSAERMLSMMGQAEASGDLLLPAKSAPERRTDGPESLGSPGGQPTSGEPASHGVRLLTEGLQLSAESPALDLDLEGGTVVGLAGLDGHGQSQLLRHLSGVEKPHFGRVIVDMPEAGRVDVRVQTSAVSHGIVYVPRDRKTDGIMPGQSVIDNFALPTWRGQFSRFGIVRAAAARRAYGEFATFLKIRAGSPRAPIDSLSGGTQQKVILARWLAAKPRVVVLDDPTRGVDHPTKLDLYNALRQLAASGALVVLVSTELPELMTLCDRVLVMRNSAIVADLNAKQGAITEGDILAAMFGEPRAGEAAQPPTQKVQDAR